MKLMKLFHDLLYGEPYQIERNMYGLSDGEIWWRDRNSLLESHGYRLRKRLRPDSIPSWMLNQGLRPVDCEDSMSQLFSQITDATRISDSSHVIVKKIKREDTESAIASYLSTLRDPKNHCVPIIDSFVDHTDDRIGFIAILLLRCFNGPPFQTVEEVVDFVQQTLEGIAFMHAKNIAHRDCGPEHHAGRNVDVPRRLSPSSPEQKPQLERTGEGTKEGRLVTGRICQVHVPELSDWVPYDPFATDIYLLGDVYRRNFLEKYSNVQFLIPLVESMTRKDPSQRPKADEALRQLEELVSQRSEFSLRWRLLKPDVGRISRHWITVECSGREVAIMVRRLARKFNPPSLAWSNKASPDELGISSKWTAWKEPRTGSHKAM
ncbi:hypothetical protein ACEPAH_4149 [Sanghuangporus vaninii]